MIAAKGSRLLRCGFRSERAKAEMLTTLFLACAVVGGALILVQVLLSLLSVGMGRGMHLRAPHAGPISAHHAGAGRGMHRLGLSTRAHAPRHARVGRAGRQALPGTIRSYWAIAWMQSIFNFQGIVAGATVLGLVGLAATSARMSGRSSLSLSIAAALVMMALIGGVLDLMTRMENDGTIEIQQAVGKPATVYLGIPARNEGQGKITISLQERQMEFAAITFGESPLTTGQKVVVVNVLDPSVMVVVPEAKYASV
jgi:hypothetical protein